MRSVQRGLIVCPRPDLSSALLEVVEWRVRAFDGRRLWGLFGKSKFHDEVRGARLRIIDSSELPSIDAACVADGTCEFVFQMPAGRKLEDRVLDVMRLWQVVLAQTRTTPDVVHLASSPGEESDECMIASQLIANGLG